MCGCKFIGRTQIDNLGPCVQQSGNSAPRTEPEKRYSENILSSGRSARDELNDGA
jgi:hypothetical protein